MFSRILIGVVVSALLAVPIAWSPATAAAPLVFETEMRGANQVPAVETNAWGFFRFFFSEDRSYADVTVDVKGIAGPSVIGADIHRGAPGSNGPVVKHVSDGGFIVTSARVEFTPAELQAMARGEFYVSLKTRDHPEGALRGQIEVPAGFLPERFAPSVPQATGTAADASTATPNAPAGPIRPPNTGSAGLR